MNQLMAFDQAIDDALSDLEKASSELSDLDTECEGNFSEVREALSRVDAARVALLAIREPLLTQIKAVEVQHSKEESLYGE